MRRVVLLLLLATAAQARVTSVEVLARNDVAFGYERITARIHYALDPANPHDAIVADLDKAPHNAQGLVEFSGDAEILRPKNGGNGVLFVNVPNRGGKFFVRDEPDEFYLSRGYTLADVGWQFDVRDDKSLLHFDPPLARGVRGRVRSDFIVAEKRLDHPIGHVIGGQIGGAGYPAADLKDAVLTERDAVTAARRSIPRAKWRFTDARTIQLDGGFVPGRIYEIIYTAADPAVVGAGLAAIRDFAAYSKHDPQSIAPARLAYAMGVSQTGRFLRHLVWQGFNADEEGRQAYDAMLIYVAGAGRGNFNHRFAQPSRDAQPLAPAFYPVDVPPFTDDGLLERARAEKVVPKMFYVNTAYEYWSRGGSLIHTTPDGTRDVPPAPTSRIYFVAGLAHVAGAFPPTRTAGQQLDNPNNIARLRHGFADALDDWTRRGVEPPPSRIPTIADGTLVKPVQLAKLPIAPPAVYDPFNLDFASEPPRVLGTYTALVPQVGADGNELAGVRVPEVVAPLATYTGWNFRDPKTGFGDVRASFIGSYFPWPKELLLERYHNADEYLGRFTAAALQLVRDRFFVAEDLPAILDRGVEEWKSATQ
jgi:hypothetical protein